MRSGALICAVVAGATLTGCAGMRVEPVPLTAFRCDKKVDCAITVSVRDCVISVDRPDVVMKDRDLLIRWELDEAAIDAKYRFDKEAGVALKESDPDDQFYDKGPKGNGLQFHWRDKNRNSREYPYEINVFRKDTGAKCPKLDPRIIND